MGTEYLVRPVGHAEDEEGASDFEPGEENGDDEDLGKDDDDDDDDDDDSDDGTGGGKVETPLQKKRSRSDEVEDERPSKR